MALELVNDIWHRVFGLLPAIQRVNCILVSKKWRDLVTHPLAWQTTEVSLIERKNSSKNLSTDNDHDKTTQSHQADLIRADNFFQLFHTISSSVVDLNIELTQTKDLGKTLDAIFQIRSLERFKFSYTSPQKIIKFGQLVATTAYDIREYSTQPAPACKDLKLLNFQCKGVFFHPKAYQTLLSGLPNLEEFYPTLSLLSLKPEMLVKTSKLKRLSLCTDTFFPSVIEYMEVCPSLEYLILRDEASMPAPERESVDSVGGCAKLKKYKNTYIVFATIFDDVHSLTREQLEILKPLFTPYTTTEQLFLSRVVAQSQMFLKPVMEFFINVMHYDINGRDVPDFPYRPSFCYCGLADRVLPIEAALRDPTKLRTVLEYGAEVDLPETSLLTVTDNINVALLLLQHGADPNRPVFIENEEYPAYVILILAFRTQSVIEEVTAFTSPYGADPHLVVKELGKRGCDFNKKFKNYTLLDYQLQAKHLFSVEAMLDYGAKWQWNTFAIDFARQYPRKVR